MKEVVKVYYTEDGVVKTKNITLPENCTCRHDLTCDHIDSIMGGNDKWNSHDLIDED